MNTFAGSTQACMTSRYPVFYFKTLLTTLIYIERERERVRERDKMQTKAAKCEISRSDYESIILYGN